MVQLSKIAGLGLMLAPIYAHPGHDVEQENLERRAYYNSVPKTKRSLDHCAAKLKARGLDTASLGRRALNTLPTDAPLRKRGSDLANFDYSHNYTATNITLETSETDLFSNSSASTSTSCILVPEAISGPYYVTGEMIRRNITENEQGIPLTLALQFIDVDTCEPVPNIYVDLWNANSTGVYSGVVVAGNGNINDSQNINTTALRGIGLTDNFGVTIFDTIVPGHYTGRTNHIHIISHANMTTYMNNTISGGNITHVGQIYFDEALINATEATYPYNTNTQIKTYNANDTVLIVETDTPDVDPFIQYAYLGDDITDGVLGWMSVGIDVSAASDIAPGGSLYKTGGVTDPGNLAEQEAGLIAALNANGQASLAAALEAVAGITATAAAASSTFVTSTISV